MRKLRTLRLMANVQVFIDGKEGRDWIGHQPGHDTGEFVRWPDREGAHTFASFVSARLAACTLLRPGETWGAAVRPTRPMMQAVTTREEFQQAWSVMRQWKKVARLQGGPEAKEIEASALALEALCAQYAREAMMEHLSLKGMMNEFRTLYGLKRRTVRDACGGKKRFRQVLKGWKRLRPVDIFCLWAATHGPIEPFLNFMV